MNTLLPPILGVIGLIIAFVIYLLVMKYPDGEDKGQENWGSNSLWRLSFYED